MYFTNAVKTLTERGEKENVKICSYLYEIEVLERQMKKKVKEGAKKVDHEKKKKLEYKICKVEQTSLNRKLV